MKLKKIACAVALLGVGSTFIVPAALAAPATAESAFYVGGSVGQTKYKSPPSGGDITYFDTKDTGYKAYGGYQINQNWGVEATYFDLGKFNFDGVGFNGSIKASAYGLAGVYTAPISNGFSVFGKLGLVRNELKLSASDIVGNHDSKGSKTGANFGFGAKYDFTPNLAVRAEWERLNKFENRVDDLRTNIDFLSTGITFKF